MDTSHFDQFAKCFGRLASRRSALGISAALGLAGAALRLPAGVEAKKKRKHKNKNKKPKLNTFDCVNVGNACRGNDALCCSGICEGKKPKKGNKDTSRCVAHNAQECQAEQDGCLQIHTPCGAGGVCYRTTGQASFCGANPGGACVDCATDADCETLGFASGSACIVCTNCTLDGTACFLPALEVLRR